MADKLSVLPADARQAKQQPGLRRVRKEGLRPAAMEEAAEGAKDHSSSVHQGIHLSASFEQNRVFQESASALPVFLGLLRARRLVCHAELLRCRTPVILVYDSFRSVFSPSHYWTQGLCRGPEALGKGSSAVGEGFAEGSPR